jgi:peptide chain release factor
MATLQSHINTLLRTTGISQQDCIETFVRSSGPGGQNVNKTSTCVCLKHRPTGISVRCQEERSQLKNRIRAWELLADKIMRARRSAAQELLEQKEKRKRRMRRRPRGLKERILQMKRQQSEKKRGRSVVRWEEL